MTYDHWKTTEDDPGDDYPSHDPADDCCHEEYDADILTGRATCTYCGHAWWQTTAEIRAEIERIRLYSEWEYEQHRPLVRFRWWVLGWWWAMKRRWSRGRRAKVDDGIPF